MKKNEDKKCVIDGCKTIDQEESILRRKAKALVKVHNEYEKKHEFKKVPIFNGYKLVRID